MKFIKDKNKKIKNEFEAIFSWKAPEFNYYERGLLWKIVALTIVLGSAFLAFLTGAWSFGLLILVFAVVYYMIYFKKPKYLKVEINERGILYGKNLYSFDSIKSFWIIHNPPFTRALYLKIADRFFDELKIIIPSESPEMLREILKMKIKEVKGKEESVQSIYSKILKIS